MQVPSKNLMIKTVGIPELPCLVDIIGQEYTMQAHEKPQGTMEHNICTNFFTTNRTCNRQEMNQEAHT